MVRKYTFEKQTGDQRGGSQKETKKIFLEAEFDCFHRFSSVLDHSQLNDDGADNDDEEKFIVEEVFEHVSLLIFELPCIDFIEDLQQHEHVEEDGVVFACLIIPIFNANGWGNTEELRTFEENDTEDEDLEETLTDDKFPHLIGDQTFSFGVGLSLEQLVCGWLGC